MEELAELQQVCAKMIRFGVDKENADNFSKELGDVLCMLDFAHQHDMFSWGDADDGANAKYEKLKVWSNLFNDISKDSERVPT
jgi:hypothetical protein